MTLKTSAYLLFLVMISATSAVCAGIGGTAGMLGPTGAIGAIGAIGRRESCSIRVASERSTRSNRLSSDGDSGGDSLSFISGSVCSNLGRVGSELVDGEMRRDRRFQPLING